MLYWNQSTIKTEKNILKMKLKSWYCTRVKLHVHACLYSSLLVLTHISESQINECSACCWLKHLAYSVCVYMSHSHCLNPHLLCMLMCFAASNDAVTCSIHLFPPPFLSPPPVLPYCSLPSLSSPVCVCVCVCVRAVWCECDGSLGALKAARVFAVVLVGSRSPLSRDQMGLGRSGTRPQALDNTASPAMCEHLFSSIKTVIWIFQSHCLMTALRHACMKSK